MDLEEGGVHEHSSRCSCMIMVVTSWRTNLFHVGLLVHFSCGLFLVPVCFRNNAKASPCFSQKAEIMH